MNSRRLTKLRHHGLGLPELMISLIISALLLTAMAAAFTASGQAVEMNDRFFRSTQAARLATNQVMMQVRRCTSVKSVSATAMELLTYDGGDKTWQYNAATGNTNGQVVVIDNVAGTTHVLADNVSSARFLNVTGQDANHHTVVIEIAMVLTVQIGQNQVTVSGAAAPRANLQYN